VRLVLFDVDGTLVDHDGAAASGVQQWLMANGWADAGTIAGLVSEWDEIAERHFPAYRARLTTFQGQRRLRLRDFLPRVGIDASTWSDVRLDELFNTYLVAYEAAWRSFPDAEPCLGALRRVVQIAVLSNGNQQQQEAKVSRTGLGRYLRPVCAGDGRTLKCRQQAVWLFTVNGLPMAFCDPLSHLCGTQVVQPSNRHLLLPDDGLHVLDGHTLLRIESIHPGEGHRSV
jgi:FMN phosphatase YigB (HAD superfamily)